MDPKPPLMASASGFSGVNGSKAEPPEVPVEPDFGGVDSGAPLTPGITCLGLACETREVSTTESASGSATVAAAIRGAGAGAGAGAGNSGGLNSGGAITPGGGGVAGANGVSAAVRSGAMAKETPYGMIPAPMRGKDVDAERWARSDLQCRLQPAGRAGLNRAGSHVGVVDEPGGGLEEADRLQDVGIEDRNTVGNFTSVDQWLLGVTGLASTGAMGFTQGAAPVGAGHRLLDADRPQRVAVEADRSELVNGTPDAEAAVGFQVALEGIKPPAVWMGFATSYRKSGSRAVIR